MPPPTGDQVFISYRRPTLICGAAGCGKTLLAMEFLVRGATECDEPGVFLTPSKQSAWCSTPSKVLVQRESDNPAQPWPRVILDDYSRAVAGLFLFFEAPSAAQTALALRQALSRSGGCLISPWRHSKGAACAL
jgi:KaiC